MPPFARQKLNLSFGGSLQKKRTLTSGVKDPFTVLSSPLVNFTDINMVFVLVLRKLRFLSNRKYKRFTGSTSSLSC